MMCPFVVEWDALLDEARNLGALSPWDLIEFDTATVLGSKEIATPYRCAGVEDFCNLKISVIAGTQYDRLRELLDPSIRSIWDNILGSLFWWGEEGGGTGARDLDAEIVPFRTSTAYIQLSMRPRHVAEAVRTVLDCPVEALHAAHDRAAPSFVEDFAASRWLPGYVDFRSYLDGWMGLLEQAASSGGGVIVLYP